MDKELAVRIEQWHERNNTLRVHPIDETVGDEPGYVLRFPQLITFFDRDKKPEDATTVEKVIEMYQRQGKK